MPARLPIVRPSAVLPALPQSQADFPRWAREMSRALSETHQLLQQRTEGMILIGLEADMPDAKGLRRVYLASDTHSLWFDDGVWREILSSSSAGGNFSWMEPMGGTLGGGNLDFTLAHAPTSEPLILMGRRLVLTPDDYARVTTAVTFVSGHEPQDTGDPLYACYPY
jgi:hypothetical protein